MPYVAELLEKAFPLRVLMGCGSSLEMRAAEPIRPGDTITLTGKWEDGGGRVVDCLETPSRGASLPSDGEQGLKIVLVDQTFSVGHQQEPRVGLEVDAAATGAARLGSVGAEPGEIVPAGGAEILSDGHFATYVSKHGVRGNRPVKVFI